MDMVTRLLIVLLAAFCAGCEKDSLRIRIERDVDLIVSKVGKENTAPHWKRLLQLINDQTNEMTRAECHRIKFEKLLGVRLSIGDYKRQGMVFEEICSNLGFAPEFGPRLGMTMEELYDAQLKCISWMQSQLDVWRPRTTLNMSRLNSAERKEWEQWRDAYCKCRLIYLEKLAILEGRMQGDFDFYDIGVEERKVIRKKVEEFLGRPIRTKEQIHENRKSCHNDDESKRINQGVVGPIGLGCGR